MTVRRLVGTAEITAEHGLSRGAVLRLLNHGEFPAPAAELRRSRVWYADEIDEWVGWARSHGRLGGRQSTPKGGPRWPSSLTSTAC